MVASIWPVAVKFRRWLRCPSWKTKTIAPKVAVRLSRFRISALIGMTTDPNCRNSTRNVTIAMMPMASGSRPNSDDLMSTSWADCPLTATGKGASVPRMALTSASPLADSGSTSGTTDR